MDQSRDSLQRQAFARARRPEQHNALPRGTERDIEQEIALGRNEMLAQAHGKSRHRHRTDAIERCGNNRPAARRISTHVTDVTITRMFAVLSSPACTAA